MARTTRSSRPAPSPGRSLAPAFARPGAVPARSTADGRCRPAAWQASIRWWPATPPCQSNAMAMRFTRSPPAKKRRDRENEHSRATPVRITAATCGTGVPAFSAVAARSVPDGRATALPRSVPASGAMRSAIAVAGRCGMRLLRSSRRRFEGTGPADLNSGTVAATASTKKANRPMARPSGNGTHRPNRTAQEQAAVRSRRAPATVVPRTAPAEHAQAPAKARLFPREHHARQQPVGVRFAQNGSGAQNLSVSTLRGLLDQKPSKTQASRIAKVGASRPINWSASRQGAPAIRHPGQGLRDQRACVVGAGLDRP